MGETYESGDPDESEAERLTRNLNELLQELRVTQTGIQILTGFLLTLPFSQRFQDLDAIQRGAFLAILTGSVIATGLVTSPVACSGTGSGRGWWKRPTGPRGRV